MRLLLAPVSLIAFLALAGCGGLTAQPAPETPPATVPAVTPISPDAHTLLGTLPALLEDSAQGYAEQMTVRIRNTPCDQVGEWFLGSGFALGHHLVVTNRHVLAAAAALELDTWNGHDYRLSHPEVGRVGDIGFATSAGYLPRVAKLAPPPKKGTPIMAVGYPLGGPLTITAGRVVGYAPASRFVRFFADGYHSFGTVMLISAKVTHGNSGGPVIDRHGRVVGVVYGLDPFDSNAFLALPISTVKAIVARGGLVAGACDRG